MAHTRTSDNADNGRDAIAARGTLPQRLPLIAILAVSAALQARIFLLIKHYSVNIFYLDQWHYYSPMFQGLSAWRLFLFQVGPVRQGIGFLVYKYVAELSRWDARAEGVGSSFIVFFALLCALWLKKRLLGPFNYWDLSIPPLFLTPVMTGLYTIVPNPSHGPFPLLLLVLYCLAWTQKGHLKYPLVLLWNYLLIFTGFGIFVGFITPLLLALDWYRATRGPARRGVLAPFLAFVLSLASIASFFVAYTFSSAIDCFQFPHSKPSQYFWYLSLMFAGFVRLGGQGVVTYSVGSLLSVLMAVLCARHAYLLVRDRATDRCTSLVITAMSGYSLLFSLNVAVGRVCLGLHTAAAARYMPYLVPAFLALYFHLLVTARVGWLPRRVLLGVFLGVATLTLTPVTRSGAVMLEHFRRGKADWKRCYLETENVVECNAKTNFEVWPAHSPETREDLEKKLSYLKHNRLNLYVDK